MYVQSIIPTVCSMVHSQASVGIPEGRAIHSVSGQSVFSEVSAVERNGKVCTCVVNEHSLTTEENGWGPCLYNMHYAQCSTHSRHSIHSTHSAHSRHSIHSTHSTHSTYSTHSTHSAHSTQSTHSTHSTYSTYSTHSTYSTYSTHSTYSTYSTHNTDEQQWRYLHVMCIYLHWLGNRSLNTCFVSIVFSGKVALASSWPVRARPQGGCTP